MLFFKKTKRNSIYNRCIKDEATKLRLKYNLYYHHFEKQIGSHVWMNGKEYILLNSNDYLGLGNHPKVIEAGKKALEQWGSGTTGARLANGSRSFHQELEEELASFLGKEACHISVAGYISCMSSIQPFAQREDVIFADKNLHSSLWSAIYLTDASVERFEHNNPHNLKMLLKEYKQEVPKMLVIEGVYSMEGHIAPINQLVDVMTDHNGFLVVDDAHGFGVLGKDGRGTVNHFGMTDKIDLICGSFSKSLSSTGGYVAGDRGLIEYLRSTSKQTIFSAALSPVQAACSKAALCVMQEEAEHRERLWESTAIYKSILKNLGLDTWESQTPSVPIVMDTKERAYFFWKYLMDHGIYTIISVPPAVPAGKNIVRTAISARHTKEDLEKIGDIFSKAVKHVF